MELAYPHISLFCTNTTMPVLYTSTRALKPSEDSEPTGLKVEIVPWPPLKYSLMGALQVQMNEIETKRSSAGSALPRDLLLNLQ